MDPYGYDDGADDQQAQALAALAGIPLQQATIEAKRRRGQAMFATPTPGGREVGRTYVASSPLEHLAAAMTRTMGLRDMKAADADMAPLIQQQQAGAAAQARQQLADKRFGQSIQLGGLRRQEAADAASRDHQAATLALQQQEAARKAKADEAEAAYRTGMLGVQREGLGLKRQEIDVQRELKAAEAAEKMKGAGAKGADDLRKEFQGLQTFKDVENMAGYMATIRSAPKDGTGDLSLIYSFVKMLDPGSVVREGEIVLSREPTPLLSQLQQAYSRRAKGQLLDPELRAKYAATAEAAFASQLDRLSRSADEYRRVAEGRGVNPSEVVLDHGFSAPRSTGAQGPVQINTKAERDALPPGTQYVGPDGNTYTKR